MAKLLILDQFGNPIESSATATGGGSNLDQIVATRADTGLLDNSLINWASPGAIGTTTASPIRGSSGRFTSGTDSTSSSTGGLLVDGGAGISKALTVGGMSRTNGGFVAVPSSTQTLTATSTISPGAGTVPITAANAITLTSNPQISAGNSGQILTLNNTGSNAITIVNGNGCTITNGCNLLLNAGDVALFEYLGSTWRYIGGGTLLLKWTDLTLANSFVTVSGYQTPQWARDGSLVRFRGLAQRSASGFTSGTAVASLSGVSWASVAQEVYGIDSFNNPNSCLVFDPAFSRFVYYFSGGTPGNGTNVTLSFAGISISTS